MHSCVFLLLLYCFIYKIVQTDTHKQRLEKGRKKDKQRATETQNLKKRKRETNLQRKIRIIRAQQKIEIPTETVLSSFSRITSPLVTPFRFLLSSLSPLSTRLFIAPLCAPSLSSPLSPFPYLSSILPSFLLFTLLLPILLPREGHRTRNKLHCIPDFGSNHNVFCFLLPECNEDRLLPCNNDGCCITL